MNYFRSSIDMMSGYQPGEQPPLVKVIKLNTMRTYPSAMVLKVLRELDLELCVVPTAEGFRRSASIVLGVPTDWILVGNGSDDLLTMIIRACVEPGRQWFIHTDLHLFLTQISRKNL